MRDFEYDGLYRLVSATGRELDQQPSQPWQDLVDAVSQTYNNDPTNTRQYTETYDYDDVGNLGKLTHQYGTGSDHEMLRLLIRHQSFGFQIPCGFIQNVRRPINLEETG